MFSDGINITLTPTSVQYIQPKPVLLNCMVESDESLPVTVSWEHDGRPLVYDSDYVKIQSNNSLLITAGNDNSVWKTLVGNYSCIAESSISEARAYALLMLAEVKAFPC